MEDNNHIGRVVYSKAGRDMGKKFFITHVINNEYVHISDGCLRTVEKPKKKKIKHLIFTDIVIAEIRDKILSGERVSNSKIKESLQSVDRNEEVRLPYVKG